MGLSVTLATDILHYALRSVPFTPPGGLYLALFMGDPESTGEELSGGAYTRPYITFDEQLQSDRLLEFNALPRTSKPISHYGVFDDPIPLRGRLIFSEQFTDAPAYPLRGGESIRIPNGGIKVV